jgi:glycosyltransferase involved in cell wall biosynthesis
MRILHTESGPNWGGQEMRILEQVRWLNGHGHQAWVAARPGSKIIARAVEWGLPYFEVNFRGSANPGVIRQLRRIVREQGIDVVDCHSSRDASHCTLLRLFGIPVVRTLHLEVIHFDWAHRLVWRHGNDRLIVVTEVLRQRLAALGLDAAKIDVINEGIDLAEFDCRRSGDPVRTELGIPAGCKVITNIGMIRPDKGQQYFVEAAAAIAAAYPEVRFLIVGAATLPEYERELRAHIQASPQRDKFILAGFRSDIADLIAASDCLVVSSLAEAHSRIIPEGFAMKRPVVATRVGGIPELVTPGVTGTLVEPADAAAIAAGVIRVLESDQGAILENAHAMAQDRFAIEGMMRRTLETYARAVGQP